MRFLLKLSGESLSGDQEFGFNPEMLNKIATDISHSVSQGHKVVVVVGGGNLFRGVQLYKMGIAKVAADHMGMLATIMNGIALRDSLERNDVNTRLMSAISMSGVVEHYDYRLANQALKAGYVTIVAGGIGVPFFSTDTCSALRAIELGADVLLKATKVDGVYDKDPISDSTAKRYSSIDVNTMITDRLGVLDASALVLARDHNLPIRVFDLFAKGELARALAGEDCGTLIS